MKTHALVQSTPEWHAHRASHFNASDAPAMMGCSPHKSRTHLLEREGRLALCMRKMGMTMPIDLLRDRIQALSVKPLGDDKGRKKSPRV